MLRSLRRRLLGLGFVWAWALVLAVGMAAERKPNFIVINVDDLGYADIEPFGSKVNRTPHLNRMAAEGMKLTSFYAAPVCSPSRAALLTGCYPKRVLPIPHVLFPADAEGLHPDEITIAELLKPLGYATGVIGKWHLGDQPEFLPTNQGFDFYYGLPYSNDMGPAADGIKSNLGAPLPPPNPNTKGQPPLPLMRDAKVLQRVLPDDQQALVERYTQEAVRFLWEHREEPFFLYLPHSAVHWPLYPGKRFVGTSQHGLFGDWVEEVDWSVGQILETLRQLQLDEQTFVLFTSDNGGQNRHGALNVPLRGEKGSTFEGGVRVPTIAWWPSRIPAGTASDAIMCNFDLLPTFAAWAGTQPPSDRRIDGRSLVDLLTGAPEAPPVHETHWYYRGLELQAVRYQHWKFHRKSGALYDLHADIGETQNVAGDHPQVLAQIQEIIAAADADLGVTGVGPGVRTLGRSAGPQPLIAHEGTIRAGFARPPVFAAQGLMIGEVTADSALAQVRLSTTDHLLPGEAGTRPDLPGATGVVEFQLCDQTGTTPIGTPQVLSTTPDRDFIARAVFEALTPGTEYTVKTRVGSHPDDLHPGPTATFRTQFGSALKGATRFVVVTGMNYAKFHGDDRIDRTEHLAQNNTDLPAPYAKPDKHLGYPALVTILKQQPQFFVGTGDNVYYDTPTKPRAESLAELRQKWHEQFVQPRYRELFARVPTFWMIDDHDFRKDDCDNAGNYAPSPALALATMLEQLPYGPLSDRNVKTYRTIRVSRDLQIWLTENRVYRSPNAIPDGPEKTIWGAEQKAWLQQTLLDSDATFKLVISPTPMIGPDDKRKTDNHTNIGGFRHERDEFFAWLRTNGLLNGNFALICGDRHWQYHAQDPSGVEEFSCGALVDANSRLGRKPGDPASTDPEGLITQHYTQAKASGGFLQVDALPATTTTPATLRFTFCDEQGTVLYEHVRPAR